MITKQDKQIELAKALEVDTLYFKREDLHPYGSHKGRSIPHMIDTYLKQGIEHFAISSSGNAALAAAIYIQKINSEKNKSIELDILVGQHISTKKLQKLNSFENENIKVTAHDRPIQTLFNITKDPTVKALRQSTDDLALLGYGELADEILEIKDLKAVFIGTSSGTTAQALAEYFKSKNNDVELHIVQTSSCHTIVDDLIDDQTIDELSMADAIVDQIAIRKDKIIELVKNSNGAGWVATNEQIKLAQEMVSKYSGLDISTNSALSIAGLMQAVYTGKKWGGSVLCMICGD